MNSMQPDSGRSKIPPHGPLNGSNFSQTAAHNVERLMSGHANVMGDGSGPVGSIGAMGPISADASSTFASEMSGSQHLVDPYASGQGYPSMDPQESFESSPYVIDQQRFSVDPYMNHSVFSAPTGPDFYNCERFAIDGAVVGNATLAGTIANSITSVPQPGPMSLETPATQPNLSSSQFIQNYKQQSLQGNSRAKPLRRFPDPIGRTSEYGGIVRTVAVYENRPLFSEEITIGSAIPSNQSLDQFYQEAALAATACNLPPYVATEEEEMMLRTHLDGRQSNFIINYVQARNAICQLWMRNPLLYVPRFEAQGVTREDRFLGLAGLAWDFLSRSGKINFGCLSIPSNLPNPDTKSDQMEAEQKHIVIIGAGMAGLAAARQLKCLFAQNSHIFEEENIPVPSVTILEARNRVGGRMLSKALASRESLDAVDDSLDMNGPQSFRPKLEPHRSKRVDLGAQVIMGFEEGNPLSVLIRRQFGFPVQYIKESMCTYDIDGQLVDSKTDERVNMIWNYILDQASKYKGYNEKQLNSNAAANQPDSKTAILSPPSAMLQKLGFKVRQNADFLALDKQPLTECVSLGEMIQKIISSYQAVVEFSPLELRLLAWHISNLEYANGTNLNDLSLNFWDQDDGFEFRGAHCMIKGGYSRLARGIALAPEKLDIRFGKTVSEIKYSLDFQHSAQVVTHDGECFTADAVISTLSLGVLKSNVVKFTPPLSPSKQKSIENLGFGVLNKIALVFDGAFWNANENYINILPHAAASGNSDENNLHSYEVSRGLCYQFWNVTGTVGRPTLVALVTGKAALQLEHMSDKQAVEGALQILHTVYKAKVTRLCEYMVTRWASDPFSFGSYSYVGLRASGNDYDVLAQSEGNLFFAGEATSRMHPATVHGAFFSGIRAGRDVFDTLIGPIKVPVPLVPKASSVVPGRGIKRKSDDSEKRAATARSKLRQLREARLDSQQEQIENAILERLGEKPEFPSRPSANPFLLYQKMEWHACKARIENDRAPGEESQKATKNEIRARLGKEWRDLDEQARKPWMDEINRRRDDYLAKVEEIEQAIRDYQARSEAVRDTIQSEFDAQPLPAEEQELEAQANAEESLQQSKRRQQDQDTDDMSSDDGEY